MKVIFFIFALNKLSFEMILCIFQGHVVKEKDDFSVINCPEWLAVATKMEFVLQIVSYRISFLRSLFFFFFELTVLTIPDGSTALLNISLYPYTGFYEL